MTFITFIFSPKDVSAQFVHRVVTEGFDGRFVDSAAYTFSLAVASSVIGPGQPMFGSAFAGGSEDLYLSVKRRLAPVHARDWRCRLQTGLGRKAGAKSNAVKRADAAETMAIAADAQPPALEAAVPVESTAQADGSARDAIGDVQPTRPGRTLSISV